MKITFFYDYICPFCFIATKRILQLKNHFDINIKWKGIEIHPEYNSQGKKRKKTGRFHHVAQTLKEIVKEDDTLIELPGFTTNSRICLEAAEYAKTEGKFLKFHNNCYKAYFIEKLNIGLVENVIKIAETSNLNTHYLLESINKREMKQKIDDNKEVADNNLVLGVPTIYFGDFRIHGVQTTSVYKNIIQKQLKKY